MLTIDRKHVLLTGVTGFLGSHLAARLLRDRHHVSVIARGGEGLTTCERVLAAVREAGATDLTGLYIYEGDLRRPGMGLNDVAAQRLERSIDEVWNSAASLSFLDADRDDIFAMNVGGTRNILEFTQRSAGRRIHHISTAYVAGNRTDTALECQINVGQQFRNPYEASKCAAELLIADAHRSTQVAATVYRPSVVVGDSRSGRVTHFHGVYAFIRAMWRIVDRLRMRRAGSNVAELALRLPGDPKGTLNFVPIDYVVDSIVAIASRCDSAGATYHVTNPEPTQNRAWLETICDVLGVSGIELATPSAFASMPMTRLEATLQKHVTFHAQYLQGEPRFDCSRTLAALSGTGIECPRMSTDLVRRLTGWYLSSLKSAPSEPRVPTRLEPEQPDGTANGDIGRIRNSRAPDVTLVEPGATQRVWRASKPSMAPPATILLGEFAKFGNCPHALVSLGPESSAWCTYGSGGVSYVARGNIWLAAGDPIAPVAARAETAMQFAAAANARRRIPVFVPSTESFARCMLGERWSCLKVGASPYFDLKDWDPRGNAAKHLRSSVNRALKSGVVVHSAKDVGALREVLDGLCADWLKARLAGTSFGWLFALDPLRNAGHKRFFVARDAHGAVIGLLAASRIPARNGWYLEDIVRSPDSPPGVCDVLTYHALRALQADGAATATLGTVLLCDEGADLTPSSEWARTRKNLKVAKRLLGGFYNFDGLHNFKSKFVPSRWESEYVVVPDAGGILRPITIAIAAVRAIMPDGVWPMVRYLAGRR
jgi:thioester reductase-like protein